MGPMLKAQEQAVRVETGGLSREVSLLRQAGCAASGLPVIRYCAFNVARHFEQVGPHAVESVMTGEAFFKPAE